MPHQKHPLRSPLSFALVIVARAARDGGVVKATVEAKRLLGGENSDPKAVEKLAGDIARIAAETGVVVEFGDLPDNPT